MNEPAPTKAAPQNRRITPRREARRSVKVECRKGTLGLGKDIGDSILDVSEDGVRVMLKDQLPIKQEVEVVMYPEGARQAIKRVAEVVWVVKVDDKRYCAGLRFQKRVPYAEVTRLGRP